MAKKDKEVVKSARKERMVKSEQLEALLDLRKRGILTRQQFRLQTFDKGLQSGTKGSPMYTSFELEKQGKGKAVPVQKMKQWTRI